MGTEMVTQSRGKSRKIYKHQLKKFQVLKNKIKVQSCFDDECEEIITIKKKIDIKCLKEQPTEYWRNKGQLEINQRMCAVGKKNVSGKHAARYSG